MEATRRTSKCVKTTKPQPLTSPSTQSAANGPGRMTRNATRQKMSAQPGITQQNPKAMPESSQEDRFNPPVVPHVNQATLLDEGQSSHVTSPPPSEELEDNGPEEAGKEKMDLSALIATAEANLEMADQLEIEMTEALGDNGSEFEDASKSSHSTYNEVEDSMVVTTEPLKKTNVVPKSAQATKPAKSNRGVRRAAKVITPRDIAEDMGDITIPAVVKMKPFNEKAKLDSSDTFFDVRDKIAKVLNRRSQDLTLGYYCSWWTVKAQASPNALRDEDSWVTLVDEIKIWLAGDKKRVGVAWHIAIMDKDDAEGSGKAATKAANEKKEPNPPKAEPPPPDTQGTVYTQLKRNRACQAHGRACWVVPPQYPSDAGAHLPVGEGFLQLWADAITQPSSGATYDNPGPQLSKQILNRRDEINKEKASMKAASKARKSLQRAMYTPSRYSRNPFRTPARPSKSTSPGPSTRKRGADDAELDGGSDGGVTYPSVEEWLGQLDRMSGRRMQDFQFISLLEAFTAEGITDLEVLNELGRDGLKNDLGLSLGHALRLAKWAHEDVAKLLN